MNKLSSNQTCSFTSFCILKSLYDHLLLVVNIDKCDYFILLSLYNIFLIVYNFHYLVVTCHCFYKNRDNYT